MEEIDEINKCKYNVNGSCKLEILTPCGLVPSKDCYYKQLKRKEKELQRYKDMEAKGLEEFKDVGGCWGCGIQAQVNQDMIDLKNLKAENEELKKQYNCYACGNCKGKEDYINLEKHHKGLRKQFDKYYQALQEIKEYINTNRDKWCLEHCNRTNGFCEKRNCYPIIDLTNILQKISEVEE